MPFKKGETGNPGGRPKNLDRVCSLAREHTKASVERLAYWLESDNARASVAAATTLLNRGWGMATQSMQALDEDGKPTSLKIEVALVAGQSKS